MALWSTRGSFINQLRTLLRQGTPCFGSLLALRQALWSATRDSFGLTCCCCWLGTSVPPPSPGPKSCPGLPGMLICSTINSISHVFSPLGNLPPRSSLQLLLRRASKRGSGRADSNAFGTLSLLYNNMAPKNGHFAHTTR